MSKRNEPCWVPESMIFKDSFKAMEKVPEDPAVYLISGFSYDALMREAVKLRDSVELASGFFEQGWNIDIDQFSRTLTNFDKYIKDQDE
jgi:hypothetical protein